MKIFKLDDGRVFNEPDFEETWDVDFEADEVGEVRVLSELGIDASLCSSVTIGKTGDGTFLAWWKEEHPEIGSYEEYFGCEPNSLYAARTPDRLSEWDKLNERIPPTFYFEEITRRVAFEIIASLWIPKEFHEEAGL